MPRSGCRPGTPRSLGAHAITQGAAFTSIVRSESSSSDRERQLRIALGRVIVVAGFEIEIGELRSARFCAMRVASLR